MLKEINYKVLSYCEIPENISQNSYLIENGPNCFVEYSLNDDSKLDNVLDGWIRSTYSELIGTKFMIEIDY